MADRLSRLTTCIGGEVIVKLFHLLLKYCVLPDSWHCGWNGCYFIIVVHNLLLSSGVLAFSGIAWAIPYKDHKDLNEGAAWNCRIVLTNLRKAIQDCQVRLRKRFQGLVLYRSARGFSCCVSDNLSSHHCVSLPLQLEWRKERAPWLTLSYFSLKKGSMPFPQTGWDSSGTVKVQAITGSSRETLHAAKFEAASWPWPQMLFSRGDFFAFSRFRGRRQLWLSSMFFFWRRSVLWSWHS